MISPGGKVPREIIIRSRNHVKKLPLTVLNEESKTDSPTRINLQKVEMIDEIDKDIIIDKTMMAPKPAVNT